MVIGLVQGRPIRTVGRSAFTLVELLVVVGLIGILLGLSMHAMRRARDRANQVQCAMQLHHLGVALAAYAADHHGWFPAWSGWHEYPPASSPDEGPGVAWTVQLMPYFAPPDSPAYHCPAIGDRQMVTYFLAARWSASMDSNAMRLSDIRLASLFVLGGENTNFHLYPPPEGDLTNVEGTDVDPDDAMIRCAAFPGDDGGFLAHPGGNNLLFGDLHVGAVEREGSTAMTFDPQAMKTWDDVLPAN